MNMAEDRVGAERLKGRVCVAHISTKVRSSRALRLPGRIAELFFGFTPR